MPAHDAPAPQKPAAAGPKVVITTPAGEVTVDVEVVATDATIMRGLMYRDYLPPDHGMLFLMGKEYPWQFYMRNTLIPLDMIFIKMDMTIAGIVENAEPKTETLREVGVPSSFVLEVNGGYSAKHKLGAGQKVRFDHVDARPATH